MLTLSPVNTIPVTGANPYGMLAHIVHDGTSTAQTLLQPSLLFVFPSSHDSPVSMVEFQHVTGASIHTLATLFLPVHPYAVNVPTVISLSLP